METTTVRTTSTPTRQAAVNGLAVVGFIALIIIGMALAVYAASFVPSAASRLGSAAVYLSSVFEPAGDEDPNLVVVPAPETVPAGDVGAPTATTTPTETAPVATTPTPVAQTPTVRVVAVPGTTAPLTGLPDLVVENMQTGYLTSSNTNSFRASDSVPDGERGAVKFTVANRGTNSSGKFTFQATLPTTSTYTYNSSSQSSLNPGERIDYVLGFDKPKEGNNRTITIIVDRDRKVSESNETNNSKSVSIDIED